MGAPSGEGSAASINVTLEEQVAVYALGDLIPVIHPEAYVHPDATVIGAVEIGA